MKRIFYARKEAKLIAKESKRPVGKTEMKYYHEYEISSIKNLYALSSLCHFRSSSAAAAYILVPQQLILWYGQITTPAVDSRSELRN